MTLQALQFYLTHDNNYGFVCVDEADQPYDLSAVTRAVVICDTLLADSLMNTDVITLRQETVTWNDEIKQLWVIRLWLGLLTAIETGRYLVRLVLYSPNWPNGLVIANKLRVIINE